MAETKEVTVKEQAPPPAEMTAQGWGDTGVVMGQDIVLAKILPMQGLSELVADGKARMGEMRDSLTGALIAGIDQAFEFLPFHVEKFWDIMTDDGAGNFKWDRTEPLVEVPGAPGYNDNLPWEFEEAGLKARRVRRMNFYGLLASQVKSGEAIPYILAFKSMSFKEGKKLFTQMYMRNRRANLPPCAYVIAIKGVKRENDKGKFIVPTMELGRKATAEEVKQCYEWMQLIKKGGVKVDDSDLKKSDGPQADIEETGEF